MYARRPIWKRSKKTDSNRMVGIVGMRSSNEEFKSTHSHSNIWQRYSLLNVSFRYCYISYHLSWDYQILGGWI